MAKNSVRKDEAETTVSAETSSAAMDAESNSVCCTANEEADTSKTGSNVFSRVCKTMRQGIYTGVYGVTYGVVYGALVVGDLIPTNNVVGDGVRDGLSAAKKAYADRPAKSTTADVGVTEGVAAAA